MLGKEIASAQIEVLQAQLTSSGRDYLCDTTLPQSSASVLFLGRFEGKIVIWNMEVATLAHYRQLDSRHTSVAQHERYELPFIEIKEGLNGSFPLRVGLDMTKIDEPVIKKTIIMIRNYKRLIIGKINFGDVSA